MLKLNKEYTYREICNELGWKVFTGGDSKKAQLKEIESAYRFFHPENKKTHKSKKSNIFTEMIRETVQPSVKFNGASATQRTLILQWIIFVLSSQEINVWNSRSL